jgi:cytoskeletal protein RodZ
MARNESRRLKPAQVADNKVRAANLQAMAGYASANPAYAAAKVTAAAAKMDEMRAKEAQAQAAADTARDEAVASEWELHNVVLGVKDQVVAQFGRDSTQAQDMGLTRKSERKAPTRKTPPGAGTK